MEKEIVTGAPALLSLLKDILGLLERDATSFSIVTLSVMGSCCNARLRRSLAKPLPVFLAGTMISHLSSIAASPL